MDAIKKLVSGRLKAQAAGTHPDPEVLAAFAENGLSGLDRNRMLNHLSACTDCREVLYLALPDAAEAQQVLAPSSSSFSSRHPRLAMRWATLAASVVILGSVLVINRGIFTQHLTSSGAPAKDTAQQKIAEMKTPPEIDQIAEAPAIKATVKTRPLAKHMTAKPYASMQFDQSGQVHFAAAPSANEAKQPASQAESAAAPSVNRSDEAIATRSSDTTGAAVSRTSSSALSPSSTSSSSRSLSADGQVQRSFDSGKTWQIVPVADGLPFHAISSIGDDIWVGGTAGTLYHSADSGRSWTKAQPIFTGDITDVEFSDAQNGLVSTADGEVWSTSDGGQSWRRK